MDGLVRHPFLPEIDEQLRAIDPDMPIAQYSVENVLDRILQGFITAKHFALATGSTISKTKIW